MSEKENKDTWSAEQYAKFEKERNRPVLDLLSQVPGTIHNAIDLGCGPGNSTALVQEQYPDASVSGIDSSANMIAAAKKRMPDTTFHVADIFSWDTEETYDLIFANASLQWVPGHAQVFPALISKLNPGGSLAVQMPDNFDEPTHRLMRNVAANSSWAERLSQAAERLKREKAEWYYTKLLAEVKSLNIWRTTYMYPLAGGVAAIVEWLKGTGLRPFLDPLSVSEKAEFLTQYMSELAKIYPVYPDGSVLLPFPRLFIIATK